MTAKIYRLPSTPAGREALYDAMQKGNPLDEVLWDLQIDVHLDRTAAKNASRAEAIRRFPLSAEQFARVKDDGRSDAVLIALAGIMRDQRRAA